MDRNDSKLIADFVAYAKIIRNRSENTLNAYRSDLDEYGEYIARNGKTVVDACKADVERFIRRQRLERELSAASANRKLSSIKAFYVFLEANYIITENPAKYVSRGKLEKKAPVAITGENLEALKDGLQKITADLKRDRGGEKIRKRNLAIIDLFLNCGLRKSELINLQLGDVDLAEGCLLIHGKGAKQRLAYINDKTLNALQGYLEYRDEFPGADTSPYFFLSNGEGDKMSVAAVNHLVKRLYAAAGLEDNGYVVHTLRKTAATLMYQAGEDIRTLQAILGHENIQTTTLYVGVSENQKRKAMARELF